MERGNLHPSNSQLSVKVLKLGYTLLLVAPEQPDALLLWLEYVESIYFFSKNYMYSLLLQLECSSSVFSYDQPDIFVLERDPVESCYLFSSEDMLFLGLLEQG